MTEKLIVSILKRTGLPALAGLSFCLHSSQARPQDLVEVQATIIAADQAQPISLQQRAQVNYDTYILGPGDGLEIELLDLPELSGKFSIGPDGTLYLPRLRALYVEGLTVEELRTFLTQQFGTYVRDPQVYVRPVAYRPIRVYVGGEVKRPGYYTLSAETRLDRLSESAETQQLQASSAMGMNRAGIVQLPGRASGGSGGIGLSTFEAFSPQFRRNPAEGITPYTDLSKVQVIRKRAEGLGGGE